MAVRVYTNPRREAWGEILSRPRVDLSALPRSVTEILEAVRAEGDEALRRYERQFDGVELASLQVTSAEIEAAAAVVPDELKRAIAQAIANIRKFHASQAIESRRVETSPGVWCWQKAVGIERVGLYVPGGTAPLFSTVLMLAIPARLAGCREVVMCTPPGRDGTIAPVILYAARETGVDRIFKLGGVQAIGAMAFGTASVPAVGKIFGPGNRYVMAAKQQVQTRGVAIDMPAGPSEVMIVADAGADPRFLAADFLSQAEHGSDSQSILVTACRELADRLPAEIERQVACLPRRELVEQSLSHSSIVCLDDEAEQLALVNAYAPEHLIVHRADAEAWAEGVVNAGSVFLGYYTPESAGDYASGTNHTLPTSGYARAYSGVNLDSFTRKITFQHISPEGLKNLGPVIETMASAEQLDAHRRAVAVRLQNLDK
ncbi:MAG TPA: histidinol dehydrogenase [Candidatus Barnesiella excrementavium]|nr:histidinol dehydrogenase [Candidatus Barnesiella excrementavium]